MRLLLLVACCFAASVVLAAAPADPLPPLVGELPGSPKAPMQFGDSKEGMRIGLASESPTYRLNHRINVWCEFQTARLSADTNRIMTGNTGTAKDNFLFVTRPDGTISKEDGGWPIDGMPGSSWSGGMSDRLHRLIRQPGVYKLQWKIGALESGTVTFTILPN